MSDAAQTDDSSNRYGTPAKRTTLLISVGSAGVAWIHHPLDRRRTDDVLVVVTLTVTFVAAPFAAWILVPAISPEFRILPRSNKTTGAAAVVAFGDVGFLFGACHEALLTCEDFKVSGNDLPANRVQVHAPNPWGRSRVGGGTEIAPPTQRRVPSGGHLPPRSRVKPVPSPG